MQSECTERDQRRHRGMVLRRIALIRAGLVVGLSLQRIACLERIRADLTACIGCGCRSLETCATFNPPSPAAVPAPTGSIREPRWGL